MDTAETELAMAERHVREGRVRVADQRRRVAALRADRAHAHVPEPLRAQAERLLALLEATLADQEAHLAKLTAAQADRIARD